jgi:hypothetical protein
MSTAHGLSAVAQCSPLKRVPAGCRLVLRGVLEGLGKGAVALSELPPPIREAEFSAINTVDEARIRATFYPLVQELHSFLNQASCVRDLQEIRRNWKARVADQRAFGTFATEPRHWYTYNNGGRKEAQFNIGLSRKYLHVGLGFEFTPKKGGDPTIVWLAYAQFIDVVRQDPQAFDRLVTRNSLEIEWVPKSAIDATTVPTRTVSKWLQQPSQATSWIFVGRLLRPEKDKHILEDPTRLKETIESVFGDLKPLWKQMQMRAARGV